MKEFLLLIRENVEYGNMTAQEMQEDIEKHIKWVDGLMEKGQFKDGNPLNPQGAFIKGPKKLVTDGPFIESKECISGYFILIAPSMEEAKTIAMGCPSLELGATLEIREIMDTDEEPT